MTSSNLLANEIAVGELWSVFSSWSAIIHDRRSVLLRDVRPQSKRIVGRRAGVDPSLYKPSGRCVHIEKIWISCFQLSGNACNVNARMPVRSQGFFKVMMWYERCTGIVEVKGSNSVQAWFFFRLSFHNCKSCVYTCDDLPSYKTFVCHMHTPIPSPLTERIIAWWAKKKTCVGVVCYKICQKRFHRELSLMLGGHINSTKIPQFEHAACILENFLHGCYENSDLRHWKIQTSWVSRKQRPPENLRPPKNSDPWVSWKLRPFNIFQIL